MMVMKKKYNDGISDPLNEICRFLNQQYLITCEIKKRKKNVRQEWKIENWESIIMLIRVHVYENVAIILINFSASCFCPFPFVLLIFYFH